MPCRVLIVEDDDTFAEILELVVGSDERFELVHRALDGVEALRLTESLRPDVVTMDIDMPRLDGVEATRRILEVAPEQRIVVVSGSPFRDRIEAARAAGASGFVDKIRAVSDLADVLLAVCRGESFVALD
jgi:DNA-binding NarL/FixJ family response regulator